MLFLLQEAQSRVYCKLMITNQLNFVVYFLLQFVINNPTDIKSKSSRFKSKYSVAVSYTHLDVYKRQILVYEQALTMISHL